MPKPRPYPKKPTESHPEVFIIESLAMDEERKGAFEGKALYESLKTLGKQPLYYYVRSAQELDRALSLFAIQSTTSFTSPCTETQSLSSRPLMS